MPRSSVGASRSSLIGVLPFVLGVLLLSGVSPLAVGSFPGVISLTGGIPHVPGALALFIGVLLLVAGAPSLVVGALLLRRILALVLSERSPP